MASIINLTFPSNQTTSQELATSQLKRGSLSANSNRIKGAEQVDYYPRKLPILFISPETFGLEQESLRGKSRTQKSVCQVSTLANKNVQASRAPRSRHQSYSNDFPNWLNSATRVLTKLGSSSARLASNLLQHIAVTSREFLLVAQKLYDNLLANPTKEVSPVGSFTSIEEMVGNGRYSPDNISRTNRSSRPLEP